MRTKSKCILYAFLYMYMGIILIASLSHGFAGDGGSLSGGPLPPPVDIKFSVGSIPRVGEEVELKIRVTPQEDMHADISCLLPEGIEPIREKGVIVRPYDDWHYHSEDQQARYIEAVELWVGPLKAGTTKEFTFRVIIPDKKRYEFIVRIEALAKWGIKEKAFAIDAN